MDRNGSGLEWHGSSLTRSVGGGVKKKERHQGERREVTEASVIILFPIELISPLVSILLHNTVKWSVIM
jgi:hypothetical protein